MTYKQIAIHLLGILADITHKECCCYDCDLCNLTKGLVNGRTFITCDDKELLLEKLRKVEVKE